MGGGIWCSVKEKLEPVQWFTLENDSDKLLLWEKVFFKSFLQMSWTESGK